MRLSTRARRLLGPTTHCSSPAPRLFDRTTHFPSRARRSLGRTTHLADGPRRLLGRTMHRFVVSPRLFTPATRLSSRTTSFAGESVAFPSGQHDSHSGSLASPSRFAGVPADRGICAACRVFSHQYQAAFALATAFLRPDNRALQSIPRPSRPDNRALQRVSPPSSLDKAALHRAPPPLRRDKARNSGFRLLHGDIHMERRHPRPWIPACAGKWAPGPPCRYARSTSAITRSGLPLPPTILSGAATTMLPVGGRRSRLHNDASPNFPAPCMMV